MAGHIAADFCNKPKTWFRSVGSVWVCDCGKVWSLQLYGPYGRTKTWTEVKKDGLSVG